MSDDFRSSLDCRCSACGAWGKDVRWARLGSSYENGHVLGGSMPEPCGPMFLTEDFDASISKPPYKRAKFWHEAEARFIAVLDQAKAEAVKR